MSPEHSEPSRDSAPANLVEFTTTSWSVVLKAVEGESAEAPAALERLCHTYWYPLHAFVRRSGYDPETAKDLTQRFFKRLIQKNYLNTVDPAIRRFCSLQLAPLSHSLANDQ